MKHKRLWCGAAGIAAVGLAVAIGIMFKPSIAPIDPPARASFDPQLVRAGARVVALGDCVVCHTANDGKPFAGGLPLATPFGTIYATNITPDADTGIGRWSRDAFARYVDTGEPFGKAGAYAIQGRAAEFIERIDGSHSGIMGLPLFETAALLRAARVAF